MRPGMAGAAYAARPRHAVGRAPPRLRFASPPARRVALTTAPPVSAGAPRLAPARPLPVSADPPVAPPRPLPVSAGALARATAAPADSAGAPGRATAAPADSAGASARATGAPADSAAAPGRAAAERRLGTGAGPGSCPRP